MKTQTSCPDCASKFDAQTAHNHLVKQVGEISQILKTYLEEAPLERVQRSKNALILASHLNRVIGGSLVNPGEFQECCLIGTRNGNGTFNWFCTGVLVHERLVLTAAHCIKPGQPYVVALATLGLRDMDKAKLVQVRRVTVHPLYHQTNPLHDIAALTLATSAPISPVPMASTANLNAAQTVHLVGFGANNPNATRGFGVLREVDVNLVSIRRSPGDDLDADEMHYGYESDLEFVAGGGGYDSCKGDSGGPVYIRNGNHWEVAGLTSRAQSNSQVSCGDGGVNTRLDAHMPFIEGIIAALS